MVILVYDPKHSEVFPRHSSHVRHVGLEQLVVGEGTMVFCCDTVPVAAIHWHRTVVVAMRRSSH